MRSILRNKGNFIPRSESGSALRALGQYIVDPQAVENKEKLERSYMNRSYDRYGDEPILRIPTGRKFIEKKSSGRSTGKYPRAEASSSFSGDTGYLPGSYQKSKSFSKESGWKGNPYQYRVRRRRTYRPSGKGVIGLKMASGKKFVRGKKKTSLRKRRVGKYKYPKWFQTLIKQQSPQKNVGDYVGQLSAAINTKTTVTFWKHLGIADISQALVTNIGSASNANSSADSCKQYICDLIRLHQWRNSMSSSASLIFYALYPRRDFPAYGVGNSVQLPTISPPATNSPTTGAFQVNPVLYTQDFTDQASGLAAGNKVAYNDQAATPYMSPTMCAMFKIVPLKVRWPDGKFYHQGILEPGQTVTYTGKRSRPYMVSYNKYGLDGSVSQTVSSEFEVLKETPLIMMQLMGTASHGTSGGGGITTVCWGAAQLDYIQNVRYEVYYFNEQAGRTVNITTAEPSVSAAEQVDIVVGDEKSETPS